MSAPFMQDEACVIYLG